MTKPTKIKAIWWTWWPLLLGPIVMFCFYFGAGAAYVSLSWKPTLELVAIALTSTAVCIGLVRYGVQRLEYHLLLTLLSGAILLREIHWDWTTKFVYVAIALLAVWGWIRRDRMNRFLDPNPWPRVWLIATGCTYVLSQAMARRAFRSILPEEDRFYDDLEELLECTAHAMLIMTILVGSWARSRFEDRP
jgi:hypothetical protein